MTPRHLPATIIIVLTAACGPAQESTSTADSLKADSVALGTTATPLPAGSTVLEFTNNDFFEEVLPFDVTNKKVMDTVFPNDGGDCDGIDYEDGTPWYRSCTYRTDLLTVTFFDFFDNNPAQRVFLTNVYSTDPELDFYNGAHVGMTRNEFIELMKVNDPRAATVNAMWAYDDNQKKKAFFVFEDDKLKSVDVQLELGEAFPRSEYYLVDSWQEIYIHEAEGQEEMRSPCGPSYYTLEEVYIDVSEDETIRKYLLTTGGAQDARVDTVEWIRKTDDGFVLSVLDRYNSNQPFKQYVTFTDSSWMYTTWDNTNRLYVTESYAQNAYKDPCDGEEP